MNDALSSVTRGSNPAPLPPVLAGRKMLIVGVANEHLIA